MNIISYVQIILIFLTCIFVSVTDIKIGKIPNKILLNSFVIGSFLNIFLWVNIDKHLTYTYAINSIFLIIFSLFLYSKNIWAGGDAKLLGLIAYLMPAQVYFSVQESDFSSWIIIILTFGIGYIYVIFDSIGSLLSKEKRFGNISTSSKMKHFIMQYLKSIIYISFINHIYVYFIYPNFQINIVIYTIICLSFTYNINKCNIFNDKFMILAFFIFDILMSLFTGYLPISVDIWSYLIVLIIMLVRNFTESYNYKEISVDSLEKGMVLSLGSTLNFKNSRIKGLPSLSTEDLQSRISEDEVASVKKWAKQNKVENICIIRKIPFAIFISIGTLLYIVFGGLTK